MNKSLVLFEKSKSIDNINKLEKRNNSVLRTDIQIFDEDTHELIFRGSNKVIISGAGFTARSHFDIKTAEITPTYNTVLGLDESYSEVPSSPEKVYLFAVGIDGCGAQNSDVYDVDYTKWISKQALVPFRYQPSTNDIIGSLRDVYFGRASNVNGTDRIAYYFKKYEGEPVLKQQYVNGNPVGSDVYDSTTAGEAETYVELRLKITKEDCRDFFIATDSIGNARINTISLLTAWPKTVNGQVYYQNIRPLTKLNFPNEALIDTTKGIDIIYHIYY